MNISLGNRFSPEGIRKAIDVFNFPRDYKIWQTQILGIRYLYQYGIYARENRKYTPKPPQISGRCGELFNTLLENRQQNQQPIQEILDILQEFNPILHTTLRARLQTANMAERRRSERIRMNKIKEQQQLLRQQLEIERDIVQQHEIMTRIRMNQIVITDHTKAKDVVYEDKQNVHNSKINKSVLNASKRLYEIHKSELKMLFLKENEDHGIPECECTMGKPPGIGTCQVVLDYSKAYKSEVDRLLNSKFSDCEKSIKNIRNFNATFGIGITLEDVLYGLWFFAQKHQYRDNILERIREELHEMEGTCSTGHLARLISVLQGYTEDKDLIIQMDPKDHCVGVVYTYFKKILQENPEIMDEMMEKTEKFKIFVLEKFREKKKEWETEYGTEFTKHVNSSAEKYCDMKIF